MFQIPELRPFNLRKRAASRISHVFLGFSLTAKNSVALVPLCAVDLKDTMVNYKNGEIK
jgi:hypothetical protein